MTWPCGPGPGWSWRASRSGARSTGGVLDAWLVDTADADEVQKATDGTIAEIDQLLAAKEKEILTV